jgi:hemolysin III
MQAPERTRSHLCDTPMEELASSVTHALGIIFSIGALVWMLFLAQGDVFQVVSASLFGGTLTLLYASSTLYHAISHPKWKELLQLLDHACIYLLIAGSYTPLTLVALRGPWGWSLFGIVWFCALAGVLLKTLVARKKDHWLSTALYIAMGWLAVIAFGPMVRALPAAGLAWLIAGGVSYTFGVVFFAWNRLPFNHAIWHLFVLGGSVCHVFAAVHILR